MLLGHKADINAKSNNNQTALFLAIQNGHYNVVETLLSNDADFNILDDNETTLQDLSRQQSNYLKKGKNQISVPIHSKNIFP